MTNIDPSKSAFVAKNQATDDPSIAPPMIITSYVFSFGSANN